MQIPEHIARFFERQNFVIISTIDKRQGIHCSAKGIAAVEKKGMLWVFDLYLRQTFKNIEGDPRVSVTALDERTFTGYTLQGKAGIISREKIPSKLLEGWEETLVRRVSQRVVRGVQTRVKSGSHYEAKLPPAPQYAMAVTVENIIDLAPPSMRKRP